VASCPTPIPLRPTYQYPDGHLERGEVILKNCDQWACEACGPKRLIEVFKLVAAGIEEAKRCRPADPARFLTITYPNSRDLRLHNADDLKQASRDLRHLVEALRKTGYEFEYSRVFESTKKGRIHIHVISWGDRLPKCTPRGANSQGIRGRAQHDCYCTKDAPCIQRIAHRFGIGFIDIRAIRNRKQARNYMLKYLTKLTRQARWPRYARRFSKSNRFAPTTLREIHQAYLAVIHKKLKDEGRLQQPPPDAQIFVWEFKPQPPLSPPPLNRAYPQRGPPIPLDTTLDTTTGELLPIPW
jgi:hypothetical protein